MNKEVIYIQKPRVTNDPVEFTHFQDEGPGGWTETLYHPHECEKIVYLGECTKDGDMFAAYMKDGSIVICKGHLNSGRY